MKFVSSRSQSDHDMQSILYPKNGWAVLFYLLWLSTTGATHHTWGCLQRNWSWRSWIIQKKITFKPWLVICYYLDEVDTLDDVDTDDDVDTELEVDTLKGMKSDY